MLISFDKLFPKHNLQFGLVFHVGANVGEEAEMYSYLGIKRQIWIEGNPKIFLSLLENVKKYAGASAWNFCVGDVDKETVLHISNNHSQSSSVLELGTHKIEHPDVHYVEDIPVTMYRIDTLLETGKLPPALFEIEGDKLLNLDLQGFEKQALIGMGSYLAMFKAIYIEVNKAHVYEGCALVDELDVFLGDYGFKRVETYWAPNKNWGDALYIKQ